MKIECTVNGQREIIEIEPGETLLEMLRNRLGLTGVKKGCEVGECGACTVLVEDEPVDSCLYLAARVDGKEILTIEGLSQGGKLSKLQQAFIDEGAVQCGFCTPGFILSAHALLKRHPQPTEEEIKQGLAGNLCRCTGYQNIIRAVQKASNE
ncbi:MAG: (2Fe-2S)-binding protein [Clostridia bacterium]|nr:(2Fe-2S)-binding protein [Clostridia bacterium]